MALRRLSWLFSNQALHAHLLHQNAFDKRKTFTLSLYELRNCRFRCIHLSPYHTGDIRHSPIKRNFMDDGITQPPGSDLRTGSRHSLLLCKLSYKSEKTVALKMIYSFHVANIWRRKWDSLNTQIFILTWERRSNASQPETRSAVVRRRELAFMST